jgi:hypothetical protein
LKLLILIYVQEAHELARYGMRADSVCDGWVDFAPDFVFGLIASDSAARSG